LNPRVCFVNLPRLPDILISEWDSFLSVRRTVSRKRSEKTLASTDRISALQVRCKVVRTNQINVRLIFDRAFDWEVAFKIGVCTSPALKE